MMRCAALSSGTGRTLWRSCRHATNDPIWRRSSAVLVSRNYPRAGPRESVMKKLLFSAAIMMIVTSPALAGGGGIRLQGVQQQCVPGGFGQPDVPPAAYPRGYPHSPGYITSYGYNPSCHNVRARIGTHNG